MMFMNEWDIENAVRRFDEDRPNLQRAARTISNLAQWADNNSDGWAYWPKPARAATKLMELVEAEPFNRDREDITEAQLTKALTPVKAFLTRQGVTHSDVIA